MELTDLLVKEGWLKTERIIAAFKKIKREDFLPDDFKNLSEANKALPIGYGQTISQPLTVAFMLELLQPEKWNRVLEIGSGSGWQTALLAHIVFAGGKIFAAELIPELMDFGRKNVAKYGFIKNKTVEFHSFNAIKGMPEEAPFDRIISAASGMELPAAWKEQLKVGGRIVAPVKDAIHLLVKKGLPAGEAGETEFEESIYPGFAFVPLISLNEDIQL